MKTKNYLFIFLMLIGALLVSCEEEDAESCDSEDMSEDFNCPTDVSTIATFCSDGVNNSYYTYAGTDYQCTGVEASTCMGALDAIGIALLEADCTTAKKSGSVVAVVNVKLSVLAEDLLKEVRSKSIQ